MSSSSEAETPLTGGHLTPVVRIGETVRRKPGEWSETVQSLLKHLETVGFTGSPRAFGFDDQGREVLSFIDGDVATGRPKGYVWENAVLIQLAELLRRHHDAAASFEQPSDAVWQSAVRDPQETVCHNDVAPWNTVFRDRVPVALIDWDWAAPGPRAWDLAFSAWQFVPLFDEGKCRSVGAPWSVPNRARRLRLFVESYGQSLDGSFLTLTLSRMRSTYEGVKGLAEAGDEFARRLWNDGAGEGIVREMSFVEDNRDALLHGEPH